MKKRLFLLIIPGLLCFFIYKITFKKTNYILALGDSSCLALSPNGVKTKSYNNYLSQHLSSDLNDNHCQKNSTIYNLYQKILNNDNQILKDLDQANYITIMVGYDELTSYKKLDNIHIRNFLDNYNNLLKSVIKNTKAKVFAIGFYGEYFNNIDELNKKLEVISVNNNAIFVDTSNIFFNNNNFYNSKNYHLNRIGNRNLFIKIKENL